MGKKKHFLRYLVCRRFNSITTASQQTGVTNARLSRYLSGALSLRNEEQKKLRVGLGLSNEKFDRALNKDC